jgi:esterase
MKLHYTQQGTGQAVILLHGMFGCLTSLGNLADELSAGYRVISVDLRNHGDSPHAQQMDIPTMASDIVKLIDELGLSTASLIGHSLGGKIAMQVALNYPHRVTNLVVADIAPVTYTPRQDPFLQAFLALSSLDIYGRDQAKSIVAEHVQAPEHQAFLLESLTRKDSGVYGLKINISAISENYATSLAVAPAGYPYSGPVLFLKGETSAYIQSKHQPIMAELFPNMELHVIKGVGHWVHFENPLEFTQGVKRFLSYAQIF